MEEHGAITAAGKAEPDPWPWLCLRIVGFKKANWLNILRGSQAAGCVVSHKPVSLTSLTLELSMPASDASLFIEECRQPGQHPDVILDGFGVFRYRPDVESLSCKMLADS